MRGLTAPHVSNSKSDMKKLIITALAAFFACASSCDKPEPSPTPSAGTVQVTPASVSVSYEKTTKEIVITADCDWGVTSSDKSWCTVSPSGGSKGESKVKVTVAENAGSAVRETEVVVRYGEKTLSIPVRQNYKVEGVSVADAAFMKALVAEHDADKDGILSTVEAAAVTEIHANNCGIADMSELCELFPHLTSLDCAGNKLTSLNVSTLYKLTHLDCTGNPDLKEIYVWSGFTAPDGFKKPETAVYVEPEIDTPIGYKLVWQDEFANGTTLDAAKWSHEVKGPGWVNNELQTYVSGKSPKGQRVTELVDGKLHINCFKEDGVIYSARVYGNVKTGWKYGYVEASILLPSGKGTWPAFWMMPVNFKKWPDDGEIDIMEEVGYHKDYVSSSLHATGHVHSNGTQVTKETYCKGAEGSFHTYGMEWTPDYFQFYVDGNKTLYYKNPGTGTVDWPYDAPFYVILNLAWGGDWGGSQGVDLNALPVTMEVDYVRVFQKIE